LRCSAAVHAADVIEGNKYNDSGGSGMQLQISGFRWAIFLSALLASAMVLTACGGGGGGSGFPTYTGVATAANIDEDNAGEFGAAAAEAAAYSVDMETTGDALSVLPFGVAVAADASSGIKQIIRDLSMQLAGLSTGNRLIGATETLTAAQLNDMLGVTWFCGGSVTASGDFDAEFGAIAIAFKNLCMDFAALFGDDAEGKYVINGTFTIENTPDSYTFSSAVTITYPDGTKQSMNYMMSCGGELFACEITSDYVGADGKTYRISDVEVTGNNFIGYNVMARFYHPDHGYVEIAAANLLFECDGWQPSSGSIGYTAANGAGTVTFDGCEGYEWSFNDGETVISGSADW
jgi:hypothetical protein